MGQSRSPGPRLLLLTCSDCLFDCVCLGTEFQIIHLLSFLSLFCARLVSSPACGKRARRKLIWSNNEDEMRYGAA